jgi:deazaflavin-dependent oxidoreductase (nitroreductase family)
MLTPEFDAFAHEKVLYLTTIGRKTGKPRTIEIWFVMSQQHIYILAERGLRAQWVRNLQADPNVTVQIGQRRLSARGRILDDARDHQEWQAVAELSRRKYGWGEGLPVAFDARPEEGLEHDQRHGPTPRAHPPVA